MMNAELCKFNPYFFYALSSEAMFACAALLPSQPQPQTPPPITFEDPTT